MRVVISIAGVGVGFEIRAKNMISLIRKRYRGYIIKSKKPLLTVTCKFTSHRVNTHSAILVKHKDCDSWRIARYDFNCVFNKRSGSAVIRRSIYSFDAFVRVLYATILGFSNGFLLHAAGIVRGKAASVFAGPSGSGKTTVASLSSGFGTVINDEIVGVRISGNGKIYVYGTPFWGEMRTGPACNTPFRLYAVYFLKKSTDTYKRNMTNKDALARLLKCCCIFSREAEYIEKIVNAGIALIRAIPVYELHFEKSQKLWKVIE